MSGGLGLKDLMRAVQQDLPITVRHERWLLANDDASYSKEALDFAHAALAGEIGGQRARRRGWRASGMGSCLRSRIFAFVGLPRVEDLDSRRSNTFHTGSFMHLKWQMAGITEGWLVQAEVPLFSDERGLGGTADGFLYDGSLFEFKSINKRGYDYVTKNGPKWEHLLQTGAYKLLEPSLKAASIVYENKESGEWREYRVAFTPEVLGEVEAELEVLRAGVETGSLPPMLEGCVARTGSAYRQCPFREICPKTKRLKVA